MLSLMAESFYQGSTFMVFPVIALILFIIVFMLVTLRVLRTNAASYGDVAGLPLQNDEASPLADRGTKP